MCGVLLIDSPLAQFSEAWHSKIPRGQPVPTHAESDRYSLVHTWTCTSTNQFPWMRSYQKQPSLSSPEEVTVCPCSWAVLWVWCSRCSPSTAPGARGGCSQPHNRSPRGLYPLRAACPACQSSCRAESVRSPSLPVPHGTSPPEREQESFNVKHLRFINHTGALFYGADLCWLMWKMHFMLSYYAAPGHPILTNGQ